VTALCRAHDIPGHRDRLRVAGMLTLHDIAGDLGVAPDTVKKWQRRGLITSRRIDGRHEHRYHPGQACPTEDPRRAAALRRRSTKMSEATATIRPAPSRRARPATDFAVRPAV
jgi:hypothetical protein